MNNHGQNSDQVYVKREKATRRASKEDQVIDGGGLSEVPAGTDHGDDEKPSLPHTQQVCLMISCRPFSSVLMVFLEFCNLSFISKNWQYVTSFIFIKDFSNLLNL